jgi:uncharacterized repeat protein (TIGR02543 family)
MKRFFTALVLLVFCLAAHHVSAAPYAYITQSNTGMLTVFDTVKNKKVTTIDVGGNNRHPDFVAMSPDGRKAYVASSSSDTPLAHLLYVVDVLSHTVTHSLDVGAFPKGLAVLPDGSKLYVAGYTGSVPGGLPGITIVDTGTNGIDARIPFGTMPFAVAALPDSSKVYVTDYDSNTVTVIDTASQTISQTITVGQWPGGLAVHPDGTRVYVANEYDQSISIIDTSTNNVTETISLPGEPYQVGFNPSGTRVYVTNWETGVWVIDTISRTIIATIDVGANSTGVDFSPDGAYVYVAACAYDFDKEKEYNCGVRVIDATTNTVRKKIKLLDGPSSIGKFIGGPQYHMTVAASGSGKVISKKLPDIDCGNGGSKCEADFYVNRKVQLQAIAADGFVFTGWSGDYTGKGKSCKFLIGKDYSVTATFEPK